MSRIVKWEYREEKLHFRGEKIYILTELGQQGWEMCGMLNDQFGTAYFKRPLIEQEVKKPFEYANKLEWVPDIEGFVAYVLMCKNGKMYKGYTGNFKQRMLQHFNGFGSTTTKNMKPDYILHHEEFDSKKAAMARETWFKSGDGFTWLKKGEFLRTIKPPECLKN